MQHSEHKSYCTFTTIIQITVTKYSVPFISKTVICASFKIHVIVTEKITYKVSKYLPIYIQLSHQIAVKQHIQNYSIFLKIREYFYEEHGHKSLEKR